MIDWENPESVEALQGAFEHQRGKFVVLFGEDQSAARTESEKNVCNNCPNWTSSEASQNGLFPYDKQALFLRNSVLAELSVYGH